jgi:hypothetical protein
MTPRQKSLRNAGVTITISSAAFLAAAKIMAPQAKAAIVAPLVIEAASSTFVKTEAFVAYQAGLARKLHDDSIAYSIKVNEVLRMTANLDSSDRCRRGITRYCR